jgi:hypothetical protein
MEGLDLSRERHRLGLLADIVHCALDDQHWITASTGAKQQELQAVAPNVKLPIEGRHRGHHHRVDPTLNQGFRPKTSTKPKRGRGKC